MTKFDTVDDKVGTALNMIYATGKPIIFVGEGGLSEALMRALDEALASHELVKVRLRQPPDKKAAAAALAEGSGSTVCGVVGHTVVLYRPRPEDPTIILPPRP